MSRLHAPAVDLSALEHFPVDMEEVARQALGAKPGATLHRYRVEFTCAGAPFVWTGTAHSRGMADLLARAELADEHPTFNRYRARVVMVVEEGAGS